VVTRILDVAVDFFDLIPNAIDVQRIMTNLQYIGTLQRYSGSNDGEKNSRFYR